MNFNVLATFVKRAQLFLRRRNLAFLVGATGISTTTAKQAGPTPAKEPDERTLQMLVDAETRQI